MNTEEKAKKDKEDIEEPEVNEETGKDRDDASEVPQKQTEEETAEKEPEEEKHGDHEGLKNMLREIIREEVRAAVSSAMETVKSETDKKVKETGEEDKKALSEIESIYNN